MAPAVLLGLAVILPSVLIVLLRSDAAVVLLSLCAGSVLVNFIGSEADSFINQNAGGLQGWGYVILLLAPAILSIIALRKSVSSLKLPLNILTAAVAAITGVLLVVPLLPGDIQNNLTGNFLWDNLHQYQTGIISGSIAIALVNLWLSGHGGFKIRRKHH